MARVVLVEDERILAVTVAMELKELGHQVVGIADNGTRAIEITCREHPDLVLMDIVIKGAMNGIETSRVINEKCPCKIVYMTAHSDKSTIENANSTTHSGFLFKPFEQYQLKEVVLGVL